MEPDLPRDLAVGVATAAYQIEGAAREDGRGPSIWDTFSHTPGKVARGDTGDVAADHYHRLDADLDLLSWLGVDTYRFSIAWPRVQPDGRGAINPRGLDFYERLVDGLLARGIEPLATLYHWDLPQALEDAGGWPARDTAGRFADYAHAVAERLGDRVPRWTTLNEPWCSAFLGYCEGMFAPGVRDEAASVAASHHLLLGHGLAAQAVRAAAPGEVGLVLNVSPVWPATDREPDVEAARLLDGTRNRWWLDAVFHGRYPADVLDAFADVTDLAFIRDGDLDTIAQPLDLLGVNYYTVEQIAASGDGPAPFGPVTSHLVQPPLDRPTTAMGWAIVPEGLTELLLRLYHEYGPVPLWVTENGAAFDDERRAADVVDDPDRVSYLREHVASALEARAQGVDLRGYLVWSLIDNFEWAEGYAKRFGIVYVDYETLERVPKTSAHWLRERLAARAG